MRALVVTNLWPTPAAPQRGIFVRDQVEALRALGGADVDVDVHHVPPGGARPYLRAPAAPPGGPRPYLRAARDLRRRTRVTPPDLVHAHFGLTAWPSLAVRGAPRVVTLHGTDVRHARSGRLTRAVLPRMDLVAAVSA